MRTVPAGISNSATGLNTSYKYNDSGIRTEKTINGTTTKYYLNGSDVVYEKTGNNTIYYSYDANGEIIGIRYNDNQYYYTKNLQGDIIGILDSNLNQVVEYTYDSWGALISVKDNQGNEITDTNNIGLINPYRYRSYRYDTESGLYYLQSRYYSSEWGRFLNSDGLVNTGTSILGHNMYAYCYNNPINLFDPDGDIPISVLIVIGVVIYKNITTKVTAAQLKKWGFQM